MNKYIKKRKFVNRGIYILKSGEYEGSFTLNIKELDTSATKKIVVMVPSVEKFKGESRKEKGVQITMEPIDMLKTDILKMFNNDDFEYIETMPKKEYVQLKSALSTYVKSK